MPKENKVPKEPTKRRKGQKTVFVGIKEENKRLVELQVATSKAALAFEKKCKPAEPKIESQVKTFERVISDYTKTLDSIQRGSDLLNLTRSAFRHALLDRVKERAGRYGTKTHVDDVTLYEVPVTEFMKVNEAINELTTLNEFFYLLPNITLIGLVSCYDGYLGQLIGLIFKHTPELIENSDKTMSYREIVKIGGLENAIEFIVSKEIDAVIRESHPYHFEWLSKKLGIELQKGLECWPTFVEICERRNLFTHANGIVSDQYLKNCRAANVTLPDGVILGSQLTITRDYFMTAVDVFYELGVKLGHVTWRKIYSDEKDKADQSYSDIAYELIRRKRYELAIRLLSFGYLMKDVKESTRKVMTVNYANAIKLNGDKTQAIAILDKVDWSAASLDFKISVSAIKDDFVEAAKLMKKIGNNGPVEKEDYHDWPVFLKFRETSQFLETYKQVFKTDFIIDEVKHSNVTRRSGGSSMAPPDQSSSTRQKRSNSKSKAPKTVH